VSSLLTSFLDKPRSPAPLWARLATVGFLFLGLSLFCWALLASTNANWGAVWKYRNAFWQGWLLTVLLSVVSLVLSTGFGLIAALARRSNILVINLLESTIAGRNDNCDSGAVWEPLLSLCGRSSA
jgi:ABC-type sulfate transport system permease component